MRSNLAVIEAESIPDSTVIHEFAVIRPGARIGEGVVIHPHVVIETGVTLGNGVEVFPGAYVGKEPKGAGVLARTPEFERRVVIGANSSVGVGAVIYYDVEIGANTLVGDRVVIREGCRVGSSVVLGVGVFLNYRTLVGDSTKVMDSSNSTGNVWIGNGVFIAPHVCMANDNALGRDAYSPASIIGPVIHDRASIGLGARLLPGVVIGEGAVVGAAALVTKDVTPYTLVMGVPAKYVRDVEKPA